MLRKKTEHCEKCETKGQVESAHMLSYHLARQIVVLQIGMPKIDKQFEKIEEFTNRMRKRQKGDVYLCKICHIKSDVLQKGMTNWLLNFQYHLEKQMLDSQEKR